MHVEWTSLQHGCARRVVTGYPRLLGLSVVSDLQPRVHFLRQLGLTAAAIAKVVTSAPRVLGSDMQPQVH